MNKYELTAVISGKATPAKKKSAIEKIKKFVDSFKGKVVEVEEEGIVPLDTVEKAGKVITKKTVLVCLYYVSNVLGTINPIDKICHSIKKVNPKTIIIIDAAQAAPSIPINVQTLGCDFLVFSAHKLGGPTGIGMLWGKKNDIQKAPPNV